MTVPTKNEIASRSQTPYIGVWQSICVDHRNMTLQTALNADTKMHDFTSDFLRVCRPQDVSRKAHWGYGFASMLHSLLREILYDA
jgi:hypothetical protein